MSPENPKLEILGEDEERELCPTLLVDGEPYHDRQQPYRELLAFGERGADLYVLLGVGLGYTAAGALHISPNARVVAWEPTPGVAAIARRALADEWGLEGIVQVEESLADFEARLLEAAEGKERMATVVLDALARSQPELVARFERAVRDVVDGRTLSTPPLERSGEGWANVARNAARIASTTRFSELEGSLGAQPALVVASPPTPGNELEKLRRLARSALVVTTPEIGAALVRASIRVDLVLATSAHEPSNSLGRLLQDSVMVLTPSCARGWWQLPALERFVAANAATAFVLPDDDPGRRWTRRYGNELPLGLAALSLGARPLLVYSDTSEEAAWNPLDASARSRSALERCAHGVGAGVIDVRRSPIETASGSERVSSWRTGISGLRGSVGSGTLRARLHRARRAVLRLDEERRALHARLPPALIDEYLARRAAGDEFTEAFLGAPARSGGYASLASWTERLGGAKGLLDWIERELPGGPAAFSPRRAPAIAEQELSLFVPGEPGEIIASRIAARAIARRAGFPINVRSLRREAVARFGDRAIALSSRQRARLIPELLGGRGRALYVEPHVLVTGDPAHLFGAGLGDAALLSTDNGIGSLTLFDAERAHVEPEDVLHGSERALAPGARAGSFEASLIARDRAPLDAVATLFSCPAWNPWRRTLHPLCWLWELELLDAIFSGAISRPLLEQAVAAGQVRDSLLALAALAEDSLQGSGAPAVEPTRTRP